jgi:peptidoglycan hydrolase-like protein with peptidoglycan-binding domain
VSLTKPDFTLNKINPNRSMVTDAAWWLWLRLKELEPKSELGGHYASKPGFHSPGDENNRRWPGNYSVRDAVNKSGPGMNKSSAIDWTFPDAQRGDFRTINKYTKRLVASSLDSKDPRLDLILFEFFGQADTDSHVEGYDELHEEDSTSDDSHLWHLHMSFLRSRCGDYWGMWALLTVLMGWTVQQWRGTVTPAQTVPVSAPVAAPPKGLPVFSTGSRTLKVANPMMTGVDVLFVQRWVGPEHAGAADGEYGPTTAGGVKWYQSMRGLTPDGVVGPSTWHQMGVG